MTNEKPASPTQALDERMEILAGVVEGRLEDKLAEVLGISQYPSTSALNFDELLEIVRDRLSAVKVKPLEWEQENPCIWSADDYTITDFQGVAGYPVPGKRFEMRRSSGLASKLPFSTLEVAKAAAQADFEARLSALDRTTLPPTEEGMDDQSACPICLKLLQSSDLCSTDINLGICHAECLEGSPTVDLETGEPVDGPIPTYRYDEDAPEPVTKRQSFGALIEAAFDAVQALNDYASENECLMDAAWDCLPGESWRPLHMAEFYRIKSDQAMKALEEFPAPQGKRT